MGLSLVLNRRRQTPAEDFPGFGAIAERFRRAGELERAVTLCREGLQRFPNHLSSRVTLGWALLDLGRYDEARVELEQVLKRAPDNLAAIRGLAQLHDRTEHDDVALSQTQPEWTPPAEDLAPDPMAQMSEMHTDPSVWLVPDTPADLPMPDGWNLAAESEPVAAPLPMAALPQPEPMAAQAPPDPIFASEPMPAVEIHPVPAPVPVLAFSQPKPVESWRTPPMPSPVPESHLRVDPLPDGPGPWPPIVEDDAPAAPMAARGSGEWPPPQAAPLRPVALTASAPKPEKKTVLGALGRLGRRVQSRRREVLSIYVAG